MIPSNFIPAGPAKRIRQINYTDNTPSREVEEWDDAEEEKKFKEGFAYKKPPSILDIRDALNDIIELIDVLSVSLTATKPSIEPIKVHNILQIQVIPKIKELDKELARL